MGFPTSYITYDSGGQLLKEAFEVQGVTSSVIVDFLDQSEDELVLGVKAEGRGSQEDISHICSPLAWVSIEGEDSMQFSNMLSAENWIFGSNIFGQHSLQFLLLDLLPAHDIS